MSVREAIDRHRGIVLGVAVLAIVGATVVMYVNGQSGSESSLTTRSFYTVDDGKTWFVDSAEKVPPFDYNGKLAYRVRLFSIDGGKTSFAGYLERYTPEAIKKLEAAKRGDTEPKGRSVLSVVEELTISGTEIKRPGDSVWIPRADPQAASKVLDVKGPKNEVAVPVMP
jgi:hypothetical protein